MADRDTDHVNAGPNRADGDPDTLNADSAGRISILTP